MALLEYVSTDRVIVFPEYVREPISVEASNTTFVNDDTVEFVVSVLVP